jgi:ADP-dependent NAD(P)H-hydrate dehydratase / NAD(P)H-hydrate epimerase
MILVTAEEMRAADRAAIDDLGLPAALLMEHAGRAVADAVGTPRGPVAIVCGSGNNGGDGFVVGRWLRERGVDATVYLAGGRPNSPEAALHLSIYERLGGVVVDHVDPAALAKAAVIVDALLGTGLHAEVRGPLREVIAAVNASPARKIAVDVPSGLDSDSGQPLGLAVRADATVTLGFAKLGLVGDPGFEHTGTLSVADIGIPRHLAAQATARLAEADEIRALLPPREVTGHKGTHGHLLVVAGSPGKGGAALLSSEAALRAGAGLVTLATDPAVAAALEGQVAEVMVLPLGSLAEAAAGKKAIAVGPGMTTDPVAGDALLTALAALELPAILDADALNHLARGKSRLGGPRVITPHPGEAARLLDRSTADVQRDRVAAARALAAERNAVAVLKGSRTVVAHPDGRVSINPTGNPGMGTAGSGDVLSGVIGALLAGGMSPWDAARAAVFVHGRAGDLAAAELGPRGLLARDIAARLPRAFLSI